MRQEFESIVKSVCQLSDWRKSDKVERDGAIGVACLLAFLQGSSPSVPEMANRIGVSEAEVEEPLRRLIANGIFSRSYDARHDPTFVGDSKDSIISAGELELIFKSQEIIQNAWCNIAGIASGLCGLRENK
jgi:hypothetical protein